MPKLVDILHERESKQPGWRSGTGKGQQVMDRGMDIVTYLYRKLVKEHQFKTKKGKDPRPFVRKSARHWETDVWRKKRRLVPLDEPLNDEGTTLGLSLAASLPDPTLVEDEVLAQTRDELDTWDFIEDKEKPLMYGIYVDDLPIRQIALESGINEAAARNEKLEH
jgi:hypothetical protein